MNKLLKYPTWLLITLGAITLFLPFLGATHLFDWDEINFAEASREMLQTGDLLIPTINFHPFWEKPPLFFWLQAGSMYLFGVNEFAARLPNAICGIITLLVLFNFGKRVIGKQFGVFWTLLYAGSLLPQLYFKSAIIDPWFNLFIFLTIFNFSEYTSRVAEPRYRFVLWASLFAGLAVLTKGPVALIILGLCYAIFQIQSRFKNFIKLDHLLVFTILTSIVGGIWFAALLINGHGEVISDFINYQITLFGSDEYDQTGPFFYHFIVLLIGCFPSSAFCLLAMFKSKSIRSEGNFHLWMLILFWVVLILFSIVKTKIVHYSSLCYFPITFLGAYTLQELWNKHWMLPNWTRILQFISGLLLSIVIIGLTFVDQWKYWIIGNDLIKDDFAKESLKAEVAWTGFEKLPGLIILVAAIYYFLKSRRSFKAAHLVLIIGSMIGIILLILLITPKVEPYSQGAAIEFYKSKAPENAIIETRGFKSYANLYYGKRPAWLGKNAADSILYNGTHLEVPVYYVGKIQNKEKDLREKPNLRILYSKNGFVFYKMER